MRHMRGEAAYTWERKPRTEQYIFCFYWTLGVMRTMPSEVAGAGIWEHGTRRYQTKIVVPRQHVLLSREISRLIHIQVVMTSILQPTSCGFRSACRYLQLQPY
eukprot:6474825-Amphidinium_carterae.1